MNLMQMRLSAFTLTRAPTPQREARGGFTTSRVKGIWFCPYCGRRAFGREIRGAARWLCQEHGELTDSLYMGDPQDIIRLIAILRRKKEDVQPALNLLETFCYGCTHYQSSEGKVYTCEMRKRGTGTYTSMRPAGCDAFVLWMDRPERMVVADDD